MSTALEYAAPDNTRRWGPIVFRPSVRSLAFLLVLGLCAFWVFRRHQPWTSVGFVKVLPWQTEADDNTPRAAFTPNNGLVVLAADFSVKLYDPSTALPVRQVWQFADKPFSAIFLDHGADVLVLEPSRPTGLVLDVNTGKVVRETANLRLSRRKVLDANDDGSRVIARQPLTMPFGTFGDQPPMIYDLSAGNARPARPLTTLGAPSSSARLICGSQFIWYDISPTAGTRAAPMKLLRAADLSPVPWSDPPAPENGLWRWSGAAGAYHVLVSEQGLSPGGMTVGQVEIREAKSDAHLRAFQFTWYPPIEAIDVAASDDGRRVALTFSYRISSQMTTIWDIQQGRAVGPPLPHPSFSAVSFLPHSGHVIYWDRRYNSVLVSDLPNGQPLALLPAFRGTPLLSPDGRFLAGVTNDGVCLLRRSGWECRDSRFGILGMPHAWLALFVAAALIVSLARDANGRVTDDAPIPHRTLAILLVTSGSASLYLLLAACVGRIQPPLAPAPLVLLCAIAALTGSRFWRWVLTCLLAACLACSVDALRRICFPPTTASTGPYLWLLDRCWNLPNGTRAVLWGLAATICLVSIVNLARHSARAR